MSTRLQSVSMLLIAVLASGGCADGAESPTTDSAATIGPATTTGTATEGDPGSTSTGEDSTPSTANTADTIGSSSNATTSQETSGGSTDTSSESGTVQDCEPGTDVTAMGTVVASSTFGDDEFPAALGIDGDPATSWFSAGPGPDTAPANFAWTLEDPRCLSTLVLTGNGAHANPDFRELFGFEALTVRVFLGEEAVFESDESLRGTPDPTVTVELGDVVGDRVELELSGHEDPVCGGFAELQITGG